MPRAGRYGSYLPTKPLDLRVNGTAKKFLEAKFTERFAKKIDEGLQEGKELEDIEVKFKLTTLKPLYTSWLWDSYDYLTSSKGEVIIKNQRKRAGIIEAVEKGFSELPPLGPFQSIDPIADQADIFLTQDTTSIYSSLDSKSVARIYQNDVRIRRWRRMGASRIWTKRFWTVWRRWRWVKTVLFSLHRTWDYFYYI